MKTIFVVDDSNTSLAHAKKALENTYNTYAMSSAARMFKLAEKITPDLILLDVSMPEMDGYEALALLKAIPTLSSIPVIFLTAHTNPDSEIQGFELGAVDYINKPFSPPVLLKRIEMHIDVDTLIKRSVKAVHDVHYATMNVIANIVERRDHVTGNHIERTQAYLEILINELIRTKVYADEISKWNFYVLLPSAQLHDVGKITISDTILNKPGKLTKDEFELVKKHSTEGGRIIDEIISKLRDEDSLFLFHAKRFAVSHHERWDGSGYPSGLKREDIPLEGRIMALVDVYDALVAVDRPYKDPFTHESAVEIIKEGRGTQFDPKIVDAFLSVSDDFAKKAAEISIQQIEAEEKDYDKGI